MSGNAQYIHRICREIVNESIEVEISEEALKYTEIVFKYRGRSAVAHFNHDTLNTLRDFRLYIAAEAHKQVSEVLLSFIEAIIEES